MNDFLPRRPRIRIDWRQYFRDFCERHGHPLTHPDGVRLLFPDGWSYSATSHRGPQWPPPEDPREYWTLVLTYWRLRRVAVRRELTRARLELVEVRRLLDSQTDADVPVTLTIANVNPDTGEQYKTQMPLTVEPFQGEVDELARLLAEAEGQVTEAQNELRLLRMPRPEALSQASEGPPP